jgi:lambda repressor-like predicted transcriptional regulator
MKLHPTLGAAVGLPAQELAPLETFLDLQRLFAGAINPDGSLKPSSIKALFEQHQVSYKALAASLNVSDTYVHSVIAGRKRDRRIQNAIAACFGVDPDRMWGRPFPLEAEK